MYVATLNERCAIAERGNPASFDFKLRFFEWRFYGFPCSAMAQRSFVGVAAETRKTLATRFLT